MKIRVCPDCGSHNLKDAWNCIQCGTTLSVSSEKTKCPKCGQINLVDSYSCTKCGETLSMDNILEDNAKTDQKRIGAEEKNEMGDLTSEREAPKEFISRRPELVVPCSLEVNEAERTQPRTLVLKSEHVLIEVFKPDVRAYIWNVTQGKYYFVVILIIGMFLLIPSIIPSFTLGIVIIGAFALVMIYGLIQMYRSDMKRADGLENVEIFYRDIEKVEMKKALLGTINISFHLRNRSEKYNFIIGKKHKEEFEKILKNKLDERILLI